MRLPALAILLAVAAVPALAACQSSQDQSAELKAKGSTVLKNRKGLTVSKESSDVKVVGTTVLSDKDGSAVVVTVKNTSNQDLEDVPIAIDVLDKKGKSVFKNDFPGIDPALVGLRFIKAGETVDWVNDRILATGPVASVKVKVGVAKAAPLPTLPELEVTPPKLELDPASGIEAVGKVINHSGAEQRDLQLSAVARQNGKIVAAGTGLIPHLKATTKPVFYHFIFVGDPKGAEIAVENFPSIDKEK